VANPSVLSLCTLINVYQAGEDLEELEEEEEEDEETIDEDRRAHDQPSGSQDMSVPQTPEAAQGSLARILAESQPSKSAVSETSPLLPRASSLQRSRIRRRRASVSHGDATIGQAVLMVCHDQSFYYVRERAQLLSQLLKSFVGTGVLFLGKA